MTMTTAEYLSLPPQERWALIEEHVFGRRVLRDWPCTSDSLCEPWELVDRNLQPYFSIFYPNEIHDARFPVTVCEWQEWPPYLEMGFTDVSLEPVRDFDEPNGWWEIVLEMRRKGYICQLKTPASQSAPEACWMQIPGSARVFVGTDADIALAVQVASMRAVGFLTD